MGATAAAPNALRSIRCDDCPLLELTVAIGFHFQMHARPIIFLVVMLIDGIALAQTAPPLPPAGPPAASLVSPGLTPALAEAVSMIREGQYVTAMAKIEDVLAQDARNPQARFLKGVVQTDQEELDDGF